MRAVVDTNIIIRAMIKPKGTVGPVLGRLRDGDYTLVYSEPLLAEMLAKLAPPRIRDKYQLRDVEVADLLALLVLRGELVSPERPLKICRDPKDDMLIETALAGGAESVVTGDNDLLSLKEFETVRFVTPRIFLAAF